MFHQLHSAIHRKKLSASCGDQRLRACQSCALLPLPGWQCVRVSAGVCIYRFEHYGKIPAMGSRIPISPRQILSEPGRWPCADRDNSEILPGGSWTRVPHQRLLSQAWKWSEYSRTRADNYSGFALLDSGPLIKAFAFRKRRMKDGHQVAEISP